MTEKPPSQLYTPLFMLWKPKRRFTRPVILLVRVFDLFGIYLLNLSEDVHLLLVIFL